jgi:EAL domain-containing protein (putative c-di-GMP-specific phosphodiesterase class I)
VETKNQAAMLTRMKCDHLQGYHYSRPLTPSEFAQFVAETAATQASKTTVPMKISAFG